MQAMIEKRGDVTIVSLSGVITLEVTEPFREVCFTQLQSKKIVFNMHRLSFVGSTGLTPFVEVIKDLSSVNTFGVKMVGAKPEFRRLIQSQCENSPMSFYEELSMALGSFGFVG